MQIYTTGAFLSPVKVGEHWVWMVDQFEDDSFLDGDVYNPLESAASRDALILSDNDFDGDLENWL